MNQESAPSSQGAADDKSGHDDRLMRLLARLHSIAAVITACFAVFGVRYIGPGWHMIREPDGPLPPLVEQMAAHVPALEPFVRDPANRPLLGISVFMVGAFVVTLSLVHGLALAYIGRCIARRRRRGLCIGFSIFDLTYLFPVPIGTALSVFALVMLFRPGVVQQFAAGEAPRHRPRNVAASRP